MRILAVGAHYDDLELSAGGTLAKFCKSGHEVFIHVVTASDYTSYKGEILRDVYESQIEGIEGLRALGIKDYKVKNLGFTTKKVPFGPELIEPINRAIDTIKPDLIISHHLSSSHQDHANTAKSVLAAARYQKNVWMFEPIYPDKMHNIPFHPIVYVDVSETMNIKIESLKCHKSQFIKYPQWTDLVTSLARLRGIENSCQYAECFEPIKMEYKF